MAARAKRNAWSTPQGSARRLVDNEGYAPIGAIVADWGIDGWPGPCAADTSGSVPTTGSGQDEPMTEEADRYLVLVTGYAAAGKSTLAPRIANELGALWISRDNIHEMVYSGWEPQHPALFQDAYDPHVGDSTYFEGKVVWNIFLWMLQRVTTKTAVAPTRRSTTTGTAQCSMMRPPQLPFPWLKLPSMVSRLYSLIGLVAARPAGTSTSLKRSSASIRTATTPANTSQSFPSTRWST